MAAFFAFLALTAYAQGIGSIAGRGSDPLPVAIWQLVIGTTALATAVASWTGRAWAPWSALAYGVITGSLVAALEPLLGLEASARGGLWFGALATVAVGAACAWYLRRATAPAKVGDGSTT
jgi:hypothetical protein